MLTPVNQEAGFAPGTDDSRAVTPCPPTPHSPALPRGEPTYT